MNYLGSELAQEYFRAIIGRFSKDVLKKQMDLDGEINGPALANFGVNDENLILFKRKMLTRHFANYLTRAVSEILNDEDHETFAPPLVSDGLAQRNPALEFIKTVIVVLELDAEVDNEVQMLKRSLLSQIGVAEYAQAAQWSNPCPKLILPDVFCAECQGSRDVNLSYVPPREPGEEIDKDWICDDCGMPYDVAEIERRLVSVVHRKTVKYQLQDVRCAKTNRVATRALAPLSSCSMGLKLEVNAQEATKELRLFQSLAQLHELEALYETTASLL